MALPLPPLNPNTPIPNNSFTYPEEWYIRAPYGPFIVGGGLNVDLEGTISSTGGGGGVNTVSAGNGISINSPTGNVIVTNTGVTGIVAGTGITVSGSSGSVTVTATNLGTVTSITAGTGLTGGVITTAGTLALAASGVTANTYTNPTLTVDQYGRITLASSNPAVSSISVTSPITISGTTTPTIGILPATTSQAGAVRLSDSVADAASVCAASTAAVKTAYDLAAAAIPCSIIAAKGTLITGNATPTVTALPVGSDGKVLTACAACATGITWGNVPTPPTPTPNYGSFLNTGTQIIGTVNVPQAVTLNTTVAANGFSLDAGKTQIIAANAGTYNLQFSLQLVVTTGGGGNVEIWLAKGGNPIPNSNTRFAVKNVNEAEFAALNFVETLAAGEYLELIWVTDDVHIQLFSYAAGANFAGAPAVPSAIVTIVPVGA